MIRTRWLAAGLAAIVVAGLLLLWASTADGPQTPGDRQAESEARGGVAPAPEHPDGDLVAPPEEENSAELEWERGPGTIAGVVRDPDGRPVVASVQIALAGSGRCAILESGADGRFGLDGLDVDIVYEVKAWGRPAESAVSVVFLSTADPVAKVDLRLRRRGGVLLRLLDSTGQPVAVSHARVAPPESPERWRYAVDAGVVRLTGWPPGLQRFEIHVAGCAPRFADIEFHEGETREITLRLEAGATISGTVIDDTGEPVARSKIQGCSARTVRPGEPRPSPHATVADERGRFVLDGLGPGEHRLRAHGPAHESGWIDGFDPAEQDVSLPTRRRGTISARLVLPDGAETPAGIHVFEPRIGVPSLHDPRGRHGSWELRSWPEQGRIEVKSLPAGSLRFGVRVEGFVDVARTVEVPPGETLDLGTIRLDPGLTLEGRVTDRDGEPIADARVERGVCHVNTDAVGRFAFPHLPPGPLDLKVAAEGFVSAYPEPDLAPDSAPIHVRLARGGLVRGVVVDAEGRPAPGLDIVVGSHDEWNEAVSEGPIVTDHRGRFTFRHPTGSYVISIWADNRIVGRSAEVVLTEGDEVDVRLVDPR